MILGKYSIKGLFRQMSPSRKKIIANVLWATFGKVVNLFGSLFVGILIARYLGPEQYGLMNYVISYVSIFTVIASFGLTNIEVREMSKRPDRKDDIMGTCFIIRIICALFGYLLIGTTLYVYRPDNYTCLLILIYGITLFSNCFEIIRNYFTSIVQNEYIVKSEVTRTIIGACIKIVLLYFNAPLICFIIAVAFDTVLVCSGYIISYQRKAGLISKWKYNKEFVPFFVKQSFPLLLSGAAVVIYQRIDQIMIGDMVDKESVGYFATAGKFLDIVLFIPMVLTQTVTPMLINKKKKSSNKEYDEYAKQFSSIIIWIALILAALLSLSSYYIIRYTYGIAYLMSVPVLQILAWKTVCMALSTTSGQLIIIDGIQKWAVIRNLFGCLTCILLNYILIPIWGIVGAAYVTIATVFVSGYLANVLIPSYRHIFKIQSYALFEGWKELRYFKLFLL